MTRRMSRAMAVVGATMLSATVIAAAPAAAVVGNQSCAAGFMSLKVEGQPSVGDTFTSGGVTFTVTDVDYKADGSGEAYGFSVTADGVSVFYVIVKGGNQSSRTPNQTDGQVDVDTGLSPGGRHYQISNFTFCYKL